MRIPTRLFVLFTLILLWTGCKVDFDAVEESVREARRGLSTYEWREGSRSLKVSMKGQISLNEPETDIASLEPEGFLKIDEDSDSGRWSFEATPLPGGQIQRNFQRNGQPVASGDETERWLQEVIPLLLRQTGLDAGGRVAKILQSGGTAAVVAEIEAIGNSSVRRIYMEELLASASPSLEETRRLANMSGTMGNSSDLERVIEQLVDRHPDDEIITESLINAISEVRSGSGRVRIADSIVSQRKIGEGSAIKIAESLAEIRSASEKANGLISLAESAPPSSTARKAMLDAAGTIRSSSEKSRAIRGILENSELDSELAVHACQIMDTISSSSERALALRQLVADMPLAAEALRAVLDSSRGISSSAQDQVVNALLRKEYSRAEFQTILHFVRDEISSEEISNRLQDRIERQLAGN